MSNKPRLINAIKIKRGNRVSLRISPVATVEENIIQDVIGTNGIGYTYRIDVNLGASRTISQDTIDKNPEVVDYAIKETQHAIVEEVYGDIRKKLIELRMQLHNEGYAYDKESLKMVNDMIESLTL